MNTAERNRLSKEAEMQLAALKRISHWKTIALAVSTIGVAGAYAGFAGPSHVSRCPWHSFHYCRVGRRGCF